MVDLRQLLQYENPERKLLDRIIANEGESGQISTGYAETQWAFLADERGYSPMVSDTRGVYKFMQEILPKVPLIDLGCGQIIGHSGSGSTMVKVAKRLELPAYIGVDKYIFGSSNLNPYQNIKELTCIQPYLAKINEFSNLDVTLVRADMLDFISRMIPGTFNFTINGIDNFILRNSDEYSRALTNELNRLLEDGSFVFGCGSGGIFYHLENTNFELVNIPSAPYMQGDRQGWIFEKKAKRKETEVRESESKPL